MGLKESGLSWHLVHTKPRQEGCALQNLEQQGYECYLPTLATEKLFQGALRMFEEPLFPRYLFIRLGQSNSAKSWAPIRSTKGVSRLVVFGNQPAKVDNGLVDCLREQEGVRRERPQRLFVVGDKVRLAKAPFIDIEGIYQMPDGERRVMVLIEFLSKPVTVQVPLTSIAKIG
jgi:transcriptional antiterminator RfaH